MFVNENGVPMITCMCTACKGKQPLVALGAWVGGDYRSILTPEGESLGSTFAEVRKGLARLRLRTAQRSLRVFEGVESTGDPCQASGNDPDPDPAITITPRSVVCVIFAMFAST